MTTLTFKERSQIAIQCLPDAPYKEHLRALHSEMLEVIENRVQVAWRVFDGEGGYDYVSFEDNEDYEDEWNKINPRHIGWVEPLFI
jgi:hypothetical protein